MPLFSRCSEAFRQIQGLTLLVTVLANFLILAGLRPSHSIAVYVSSTFTAICVRLIPSKRQELGRSELGEAFIRVCLRELTATFRFVLAVGFKGDVSRFFDLCVAYVMNSAKDRRDSPEGCTVRIVLKASRKYSKLSERKTSLLRASTHFFVIPALRSTTSSRGDCGALTHLREPFRVKEMVLAVSSKHHKLLVI